MTDSLQEQRPCSHGHAPGECPSGYRGVCTEQVPQDSDWNACTCKRSREPRVCVGRNGFDQTVVSVVAMTTKGNERSFWVEVSNYQPTPRWLRKTVKAADAYREALAEVLNYDH